MADDDGQRRAAEFMALSAIYEGVIGPDVDGPWQIPLDVGDAVLEIHLPGDYPSTSSPTPILFAPSLDDSRVMEIAQELLGMFEKDSECVFTWVAHVKELLEMEAALLEEQAVALKLEEQTQLAAAVAATEALAVEDETDADANTESFTYVPLTTKYGQRVRHFGAEVADDHFKVDVVSGAPFHPPKSGPGETFQAHVAPVTSMAQVNWVLATLLRDKKIARATHNMIAYSFVDERGVHVFDNDDDGESASGAKLASTIENTGASNVLVVVSRWFGGVHLGPARFKYIASVAGALLDEQGFCRRHGTGPGGAGKKKKQLDS